ncbi:MAG TPA: hypothetical protein VLY23_18200 [Candidatus Acidoferrum sp.]|nr:hypothetical protein [Candidatus Acidoferrum sp.]
MNPCVPVLAADSTKFRCRTKRSWEASAIALAAASLLLFAAGASAQTTYQDPGGSFVVSVPAGWHAERQQDGNGVTISKGDVSITVGADPTDDGSTPPPAEVLDSFEQQFTKQCPSPGTPQEGTTVIAGLSGRYAHLSCNDQEHGTWLMMFSVATSNGHIVLFQSSLPSSQYSAAKPILDDIAKSFHLSAGIAGTQEKGEWVEMSPGAGNAPSGPDPQKMRALDDACKAGVLTADECAAKRAELMRASQPSQGSANDQKLQALERACRAGVFTPDECAAKRAALIGTGPGGQPPPPSNAPNGPPAVIYSNSPNPPGSDANGGGNGNGRGNGNVYSDPAGVFSLMIPPGWTAKTQGGCYGPSQNCPPDASGVNINENRGKGWAFIAPFSAEANEPADVVKTVAGQYQEQYRNFTMVQNQPQKFNGVDITLGTFTGTDPDGVAVSLIIVGIAGPGGHYYVVSSSVPQSEPQSVNDDLSDMFNSIRFGRQ